MISETTEIQPVHSAKRLRPLATGLYSLLFVLIEILMQTAVFSVRHFSALKQFPFSSTTFVVAIELSKFTLCFLAFCRQQRRVRFVPSPVFLLPAFFQVVHINLFFYCMNFMTLPTWNVLVQLRTVFAAVGGYVICGRPIGRRRWLAMIPLLLAAGLAVMCSPEVKKSKQLFPNDNKNNPTGTLWWVLAALVSAACLTLSTDISEYISTLGIRPITEKYIQLHFFCAVISFMWAELVTNGNLMDVNIKMFFPLDFYLCVLTPIVGAFGGLAATYITVTKLSSAADEAASFTAWIPLAVFLSSVLVSSLVFRTQRGYSYAVLPVIVSLLGVTSYFNSTPATSSRSPEQHRNGIKQDASEMI